MILKPIAINVDLGQDDLEHALADRRQHHSATISLFSLRGYSEASSAHLGFISDVLSGANQIDLLEIRMPLDLTALGLAAFLNLFMQEDIKVNRFVMLRQWGGPAEYFPNVHLNCSDTVCRNLSAFVKRCGVECVFLNDSPLIIDHPEQVRHFFDALPDTVLKNLHLPSLRLENEEALEKLKSMTHDVLPFSKLEIVSVGRFHPPVTILFDMSQPEDSLLFKELCAGVPAVTIGGILQRMSDEISHSTQGSTPELAMTETPQPAAPSISSTLMRALATQPREVHLELQYEYLQEHLRSAKPT